MQYRRFGQLDVEVSALGFGCMRFPTVDGDDARIDEQEAARMLRYAIDRGVNYLDTAYPYHAGQSEAFLGRVLQGGYREKVMLATKMPSWEVEKAEDFDRYLDEQLARLQTDHLDVYLLHSLNGDWWPKLRDLGVLDWAEWAMADGRFDHLGFSLHDQFPVFREIVDAHDGWAMCQIQYNYMDVDNQAGVQGLRYAASKGSAVAIMEPLLGGKLVDPPARRQRTPAEWALHWLPLLHALPERSGHPRQFRDVQRGIMYDKPESARGHYRWQAFAYAEQRILDRDVRAAMCVQCGLCEEKCPQQIPISAWMPVIHRALGEGAPLRRTLDPQLQAAQ